MNCLIVDDDHMALTVTKSYLEKLDGINILETFTNPLDAIKCLQSNTVDLLFLDVEMPQLSGLDLLKTLHNPPLVVLTTAKKDYALESYELEVMDYILKPVSLERLLRSVNKAQSILDKREQTGDLIPDFLFLKENKRIVKVGIDEILYLESIKDYVKVVLPNREVITRQQMSFFEEKLPMEKFLRIHRSFMVSVSHIEAYGQSNVEVGGTELPISRSYRDKVSITLKKISGIY